MMVECLAVVILLGVFAAMAYRRGARGAAILGAAAAAQNGEKVDSVGYANAAEAAAAESLTEESAGMNLRHTPDVRHATVPAVPPITTIPVGFVFPKRSTAGPAADLA